MSKKKFITAKVVNESLRLALRERGCDGCGCGDSTGRRTDVRREAGLLRFFEIKGE